LACELTLLLFEKGNSITTSPEKKLESRDNTVVIRSNPTNNNAKADRYDYACGLFAGLMR
jgi:hypothetical protein